MTFIVGLAGPGNVGKSTTAQKIKNSLSLRGINAINYAFATPLYEICALVTGIPVETLKSQNFKEKIWNNDNSPLPCLEGWTPRKLLQIIGTECFRGHVDSEFWIQLAVSRVKNYDVAIFEDARFGNEYSKCDVLYELHREGIDYARNHASAMPPDKNLITSIIELTPQIDLTYIVEDILHTKDKSWHGTSLKKIKSDVTSVMI